MDTHLSDFPIEPARLVPASGIHPGQVARSLGIDGERLAKALESFGNERVGEIDIRPVPNPFRGSSGMAVLPDGEQVSGSLVDPWVGAGQRPHIVATRFNGGRLRAWRTEMKLTQPLFAEMVRRAGERIGEPNSCTKRTVQKWESGEVKMPHAQFRRAVELVIGMPFVALCTPVLPIDPDEATAELTEIAANFNELMNRMIRYYQYLTR